MKYIKFTKQYLAYGIGTVLKGKDFDGLVNLSKVAVYIDEKEYIKLQSEAKKKAFDLAEKAKEASKPKTAKTPCIECGEKAKSLEAVIEDKDKEIEALKSEIELLKVVIDTFEKKKIEVELVEEKPKAKTPTKTK